MLSLRSMTDVEVRLVRTWLADPEVARWFLAGSSLEEQIEDLRQGILGEEPTEVLLVTEKERPIGWCQWYLCRDYPDHAAGLGAGQGDVGIDYAIGEGDCRSQGVGTELIAALVLHIRRRHPAAPIIADPEASNLASRRVLEKNGFQLIAERPVSSEPTEAPMAIYRLEG